MSEMIERVAKALSIADGNHPDARSNDEDEHPMWTLYLGDARAAIEAMREPTGNMLDAGWEHTGDPCWKENVADAWRAMVNVALGQSS